MHLAIMVMVIHLLPVQFRVGVITQRVGKGRPQRGAAEQLQPQAAQE